MNWILPHPPLFRNPQNLNISVSLRLEFIPIPIVLDHSRFEMIFTLMVEERCLIPGS